MSLSFFGAGTTTVDKNMPWRSSTIIPPMTVRKLALLLTFVTGFTGLVYEVTWHKYLANFLGSQAQATAVILAVFLGGLSAGYALFGRISRSRTSRRLLALYGALEVLIGLWALLFPLLYRAIWQTTGIIDNAISVIPFPDILVCILLIGFPTTLMGATLPLLTQSLALDIRESSTFHGKVYAINTLGAFFGAITAGVVLLPWLGLSGTLYWMAPLNIIAGIVLATCAFTLENKHAAAEVSVESAGPVGGSQAPLQAAMSLGRAALLAGLAGFYAISLQTVLVRMVGLSIGSSEYAFAVIVAVFILMLALGAWRLAGRKDTPVPLWINQSAVLAGCLMLYFLIPHWPYLAHVLRVLFTSNEISFYVYHTLVFIGLGLMLLLPVGAMGATMPLLFGSARTHYGRIGQDVGVLYAVNTIGCVAGALLGGFYLLYLVNLDEVFKICMSLTALTVMLALPSRHRLLTRSASASVVAAIIILIPLLPGWNVNYLGLGLFRIREATNYSFSGTRSFWSNELAHLVALSYQDGPNVSISVVQSTAAPRSGENAPHPSRILFANGKSEGNTVGSDLRTTRMLAHLPALLHTSDSRKAMVIGFGTGITVGSLTLHPDIDEVQCAEISPAVRQAAPYFDFANHDASESDKLSWRVGDAYRVLGTSRDRYSVIISEPSNPWIAGVEKLYTQEFYSMARDRVAPGGIFVQWMQLYSASPETLGLVIRSFSSVFPSVRLFHNTPDLFLLGSEAPLGPAALNKLKQGFSNAEIRRDLAATGIMTPEALLATELWVSPVQFPGSKVQTLDFPRLSYMAGRDFFLGNSVDLHRLPDQESNRRKSRRAESAALISLWQDSSDEPVKALHAYAQAACLLEGDQLPVNWQEQPRPCRAALTALILAGDIDAGDQLSAADRETLLTMLQPASATTDASPAQSVTAAEHAIRLFAEHDSVFVPLDPGALLHHTSICRTSRHPRSIECRANLIEALYFSPHIELAKQEYRMLIEDSGGAIHPAIGTHLEVLLSDE
jgi:spermidine synthase